jgi:hypothetical protein
MADQQKIVKAWKAFSGTEAYSDLLSYIDDTREMYRKYAEERAMPHPMGEGVVPLTNEDVASLLQNSRGLNIVRTYIELRVNSADVAQSNK